MGEREARITELTDEVEQLTSQLNEQQEKLDQLQNDKAALEADLQQRDEDLSQVAPPPPFVFSCCFLFLLFSSRKYLSETVLCGKFWR